MTHKAITVNLRWLSVLLAAAALPHDVVISPDQPWVGIALGLFVLSNIVLLALPADRFGYQPSWFGLVLFDVAMVSVVTHQVAIFGGDAFFLYLPVIAWASCHQGQRGVCAATLVTAVANLAVMWLSVPHASVSTLFMFGESRLTNLSMLLVVGVFFSYQAQRLKQQTDDSEALAEERRDMELVLGATREFSGSLRQTEVLSMLIQQVVSLVGAFRCSVAHVDEAGRLGSILISREMLDSSENFGSRTLRISLSNYPEIRRAVQKREAVLVNDVAQEAFLAPVADTLKQIGIRSLLVVPVAVEDPVVGTLTLCLARRDGPFSEREVKLCELVAGLAGNALKNAYMHESLASKNVSLKKLAVSDPLTGLHNRRFFDMRLSEECRLAERHNLPLSMLLMDVDFFKRINDTYGHPAGDKVLVELGRVVPRNLRQSDCMARYGGEEFVILLPLTNLQGAIAKAEEIRLAIKEMAIELETGEVLRITASLGAAQLGAPHCSDQDALVAGADHGVYEAKERGRDQVCGYNPDAVEAEQPVA